MSLVSLVAIEFKYIYLTNSRTSQITIFLHESLIQELAGWSSSIWSQEGKFFLQSKEILNFKQKNLHKNNNNNDIFWPFLIKFYCLTITTKRFLLFYSSSAILVFWVNSKLEVGASALCYSAPSCLSFFQNSHWKLNLHNFRKSATKVIAINVLIGGLQMSDYRQLSDYTARLQHCRLIREKYCCLCSNYI